MPNRVQRGEQERASFSRKWWAVALTFASSLLFLLFQGGKLASVLFLTVCILCVYLLLGRFSGIVSPRVSRMVQGGTGKQEFSAGSSLEVRLHVQIPGIWPVPYVKIRDRLIRNDAEYLEFETVIVPDWKRRGTAVYKTPPLKRGHYRFGQTVCAAEDIFGLLEHQGKLLLEQQFRILPKMADIKQWKHFRHIVKGAYQHSVFSRSFRETSQINGVRDYVYGDRLSRIHWNATARTGKWKSKEFERESLPQTYLVLDREKALYKHDEQFELAVSAAASLISYFQRHSVSVGMLSNGTPPDFFAARRGAEQARRLTDYLVDVQLAAGLSVISAVREYVRHLPSGSLFVFITPRYDDAMLRLFHWLAEQQFGSCLIQVMDGAFGAEDDQRPKFKAGPFAVYTIRQLTDLPNVLGSGYG
jgi:uncharacterized protein (DUF58 family)